MLIDTRALREDSTVEGDVVIAGGGMAGITLAKQLGDAGLDVVILESGGATPDARVQALYEGSTSLAAPGNDARDLGAYLRDSRVRCFGGSGNLWGGKCAPLDPIDFEKRSWIAHSGWPLTRAQMQPYYDRACRTLGLDAFDTSPESVLGTRDPVLGKSSTAFTLRPRRYSATTGSTGGDTYEAFKRTAAEHPASGFIYTRMSLVFERQATVSASNDWTFASSADERIWHGLETTFSSRSSRSRSAYRVPTPAHAVACTS